MSRRGGKESVFVNLGLIGCSDEPKWIKAAFEEGSKVEHL